MLLIISVFVFLAHLSLSETTTYDEVSACGVSDGGLYENNGFLAAKELPPDYMYIASNSRKHKFGYRLKRFKNDPDLKWEEGLTERELAELNGLVRVWDAGKTRYRKSV